MRNDKLVSIAMATYNGEKYLEEQLDSIYAQTYKNIEVIVCDDKSSDQTIEILEKYKQKYGLEYYINKQNLGYVKNFEKVVSLSTGEFIALSDQDDIWLPNKIEMLIEEIGDSLLIHSDAYLVNESGKIISDSFSKSIKKRPMQTKIEYLFHNNVTGCTMMFHKKLLDYALPIPENFPVHDWWFAIMASKYGNINYFKKNLIKYRQHSNNQIGGIKEKKGLIGSTFINKGYCSDSKLEFYNRWSRRMEVFTKISSFDTDEKKIVISLYEYYNDFCIKKIRLKSFFFHLKYFNYFNYNKSLIIRVKELFLSILGCGKCL